MLPALLALSLALPSHGAPLSPEQAQRRGWEFQRLVDRKLVDEPYLHYDSRFALHQEWTRRYQRFGVYLQTSGTAKRLFLHAPKNVTLAMLEKAYAEYGAAASTLLDELFPHIVVQRAMNPHDADFDREYARKVNASMRSMLPRADGSFSDYRMHDCDYVSQPLNALWYALNVSMLIDEYAQAVFPETWPPVRERAARDKRLKPLDEYRRRLEAGVEETRE